MVWRRFMLVLSLAFLFVLGVTSGALAADLGPGARAMGMAGAYVAVADDGTAAYWNPAGIAQFKILAITPSFGAGGDWTELQTSIGEEFPPNLGNTELQINGLLGALSRGVGVSVLFAAEAETSYTQTGDTTTSTGDVKVLGTGLVTMAHRFGDVFALGANLKGFYGKELSFSATKSTSAGSGHYDESLGNGYGFDVGALFHLGEFFRVGLNLENVYARINWEKTPYDYDPIVGDWVKGTPTTTEEDLQTVAHLGLAVKPPLLGTLIAFQVDSPCGEGITAYRIGLEYGLLVMKLRAGAVFDADLAATNYTAGLGFKLGPVGLDLAAVADEGLGLEMAVLTAGFSF
ncbi:MAG: hypothetical protein GX493_06380 [Firmicutes bacterium]|nr:hypothetical protein [Bacillota bacterium]